MTTLERKLVCVTGLPRSGSTLLCQLLAQHPDIASDGHSSPMAPTLDRIRHSISDNDFFLSRLDVDFERSYERLRTACQGFLGGWFAADPGHVVVDKNRGWLHMVESLEVLHPDYLMLVCIRRLDQILGSIEFQHHRTRLIDFPDHLDAHDPFRRADALFGRGGIVGRHLGAIEYVRQIGDPGVQDKILYVPFEYLCANPGAGMCDIFRRIGVAPVDIDPDNLALQPRESDSHYRFKYPHATHARVRSPRRHEIIPAIAASLGKRFGWYYRAFYPEPPGAAGSS